MVSGLLSDPIFWGAVLALIGVLLGQLVIWKSKGRDSTLSEIQVAISFLRAEYDRLTEEVEKLRKQVDDGHRSQRLISEKFSVALSHAATLRIAGISLFTRLDKDRISHADLPPVPEVIYADMMHEWPEAFEDNPLWNQS